MYHADEGLRSGRRFIKGGLIEGVLGINGLTAQLSLHDIGNLRPRETLVVTAAPQALVDVYAGRNRGKKLVKLRQRSDGVR